MKTLSSYRSSCFVRPHRGSGFTLVELLVVMAIVGLLVALLMPTLARAKDVARSVACKSKEHQLGVAFANYLGDYRGIYPYANPARYYYYSGGYSWSAAYCWPWQMAVSAYIGNYKAGKAVKALLCDSNPWPYYVSNAQSDPATTYGMNASAFPSNWGDQSGNDPFLVPSAMVKPRRDSDLKAPSNVLFFGEVPNSDSPYNPWGYRFMANVTEYVPFAGPTYKDPKPSGYWLSDEFACRTSSGNPCASVPHQVSWNALMADGHVQLDSKSKLIALTAVTAQSNLYWANK